MDCADGEMGDVAFGAGEEVEEGLLKVGWEEVPVEAGLVVGMEGKVCYAVEGAEHVGEEGVSVGVVGGRVVSEVDMEGPHDLAYMGVMSDDVSELFIAGFGGRVEGEGDG